MIDILIFFASNEKKSHTFNPDKFCGIKFALVHSTYFSSTKKKLGEKLNFFSFMVEKLSTTNF